MEGTPQYAEEPTKEETIEKCRQEAIDVFTEMDLDLLEKFAQGTETEDEHMDNGPTWTDGFGGEEVKKVAQDILEKRREYK